MSRRKRNLLLIAMPSIVIGLLVSSLWVWNPLDSAVPGLIPGLLAEPPSDAEYATRYAQVPYVLEAGSQNGEALVLGIRHTNRNDDPQIVELRRRFAKFAPTLVLVEGRLGWHFGGASGLLESFGESGEAVALAYQGGIPALSLEPEFHAEVADAVLGFGEQKTLAFYALRVFISERDRGHFEGGDLDAEMAALLAKRASRTGLHAALPDIAALDRFWVDQGVLSPDWRTLRKEALWRKAGDAWTHQLGERINVFRDRAFVAAITHAVAQGERVLAVCGSSHAILFEPALRAAIE